MMEAARGKGRHSFLQHLPIQTDSKNGQTIALYLMAMASNLIIARLQPNVFSYLGLGALK